ncbi:hypothetical protein V8C43DRAFT_273479 [Trichoderma afarasin]
MSVFSLSKRKSTRGIQLVNHSCCSYTQNHEEGRNPSSPSPAKPTSTCLACSHRFLQTTNQATFHSCHPVHAKNTYAELSRNKHHCLVPPSINIKPLFHIRDGAGLAPFCMCSSLASPQAITPRRAKEKGAPSLDVVVWSPFSPLWFIRKGEVKRCPA